MSSKYRAEQKLRWWLKEASEHNPILGYIRKRRHDKLFESTRRAIQRDGVPCTADFLNGITDERIVAFIVFGSLLGVIREGHFLAHDEDIDTAVVIDGAFTWEKVTNIAESQGLTLMHSFSLDGRITEQSYTNGMFKIDVFGLFPDTEGILTAYLYTMFKDTIFDDSLERSVLSLNLPQLEGVSTIEVDGHTLYIPANHDDFLTKMYGPNWRIPDPSWPMGKGWNRLYNKVGRKHLPEETLNN